MYARRPHNPESGVSDSETPRFIYQWATPSGRVSEEQGPRAILDLLDDEYAYAILTATSREPMSANTLSEECDASPPTIYRRINRLREEDLLTEELHIDPDGNHYHVYAANLDRVELRLDDGAFDVTVVYREDVADRFTRLWEGIRGD